MLASLYNNQRVNAWHQTFSKSLSGTVDFAGVIVKQTQRALSGVLTFSPTEAFSHVFLITLTAALTFAGAVNKQTRRVLSGTLDFISEELRDRIALALKNWWGVIMKRRRKR